MILRLGAVLFLFVAANMHAQAAQSTPGELADEKSGFRDARFGMPLSELGPFKIVPQEEYRARALKAVRRRRENLTLFDRRVSAITYYFFRDRLARVDVEWGAYSGALDVLHGFRDAFGAELKHSPPGWPLPGVGFDVKGEEVHVIIWCSTPAYTEAQPRWVAPDCRAKFLHAKTEAEIQDQIRKDAAAQF
jgi:hypothetical protein